MSKQSLERAKEIARHVLFDMNNPEFVLISRDKSDDHVLVHQDTGGYICLLTRKYSKDEYNALIKDIENTQKHGGNKRNIGVIQWFE